MTRRHGALVLVAAVALSLGIAGQVPAATPRLTTTAPVRLAGSSGSSEPRIAVDPRTDRRYAVANAQDGSAVVYSSRDGRAFARVKGDIPGQISPTIDLDVLVTPSGRLIANELDSDFSFPTGYSDDGGATWKASSGIPNDLDRQWLAAGPKGQVYLVWHNFVSGLTPAHEVMVQTSTDGGATFGAPVPVAPPGSAAAVDLGCGDSTGPSGIAVDQRTGRLYVAFATRTSAVGGGCGKAADPSEGVGFNVVPSNHVWVATSPDGSLGSWTDSLAVDTAAERRFVALQYAGISVDAASNVWLSYTESVRPDDYTSEVRLRSAPAGGTAWRKPVVVPGTQGGSLFALVAAGDAGRVAVSWLALGADASWYPRLAVSTDALGRTPHWAQTALSQEPTHRGSPASMSAACGTGPTSGLQQGLVCGRYLDNFGIAVDRAGRAMVVWPSQLQRATFVATQTAGPDVRR